MYCGQDFPLANPDEAIPISFDFKKDFATGDNIQSVVWTLAAFEGTDAGAAGHLQGAPTISGQVTTQMVSGLVDGVVYRIRAKATSVLGSVEALHSYITCKAPVGADT
jgi:hypothetical protein